MTDIRDLRSRQIPTGLTGPADAYCGLVTDSPIAELVASCTEGWEGPTTEEAVFGTRDPGEIEVLLSRFCVRTLGSGIETGLFYGSSVGCVAGVELSDRRRVVIKAYQPRWSHPFLAAAARVQRHLAGGTYPCPDVIAAAQTIGPARANVESYLADPGCRPLTSSDEMAVSAAGLAEQINRCRSLREPALAHHPLNRVHGGLWPEPHNPIFDFSVKAEQARWIDDLAARAVTARDRHPLKVVIAHTDWSARNIRVVGGELAAVYDWDSVSLVSEGVALGQAAATWRATGEPGDPVAPGPEEVTDFISCYEHSAGQPLSREEHQVALAAALWVLCYTARCEHALEAVTGLTPDRARARLATDGQRFLA